MIMQIEARNKKMLSYLINANDYVSIDTLSKQFNLSRRSVYYMIEKTNEWLCEQSIPRLEVERKKGIFITSLQKELIEKIFSNVIVQDNYIFSPSERAKIIICLIVKSEQNVTVEQMMELLKVSRNTVFADLKAANQLLSEYHLVITNQKKGYIIEGNTIKIRAVYFLYINLLLPLIKNDYINLFDKNSIKKNLTILQQIEKELHTHFVEGTLPSLATLLPVMEKNKNPIDLALVNKNEIMSTKEFILVDKYFSNLAIDEKCYLSLHLLGSRLQNIPTDLIYQESYNRIFEMAKILVSEFKRIACVEFENQEDIEHALFIHLKTSIYRYQYGIQIGNPMMDDIKKQYASLFEITKKATEVLSNQLGLPIPDGEIAYLTLHFGGFLRSMKTSIDTLKILIVCPNGVSTGNMLKGEISSLLPNAKIIGVVSADEVTASKKDCDFIISSVNVKTNIPVIVVNPILTDSDRIQILKKSMSKTLAQTQCVDTNTLFDIVSKYVDKKYYSNLYKDIENYVASLQVFSPNLFHAQSDGLIDFLDQKHLAICETHMEWMEAIHFASKQLLKNGSITPQYVSSIISQIHVYGPYMFITPDVILAHAKSEDGALSLDLSMVIFKEEVVFSELRKAKIMIVLSTPDAESHLHILQDINTVFSKPEQTKQLLACDSLSDTILTIKSLLSTI